MSEEQKLTELEFHKKAGVDLFNMTWDLLDKKDRTQEENDRMIHAAHASRYHWGLFGKPENFARGEWQVSRVYAVLGRAEPALYHAQRSLDICLKNGIGDFDLAFAHEALARSHALAGNAAEAKASLDQARKAADGIPDEKTRTYFLGELATVPGYQPA
jgi:tetratricopeptide (TPR) repeat protein